MTFPIFASLLVRLVVLLPFQILRLSLATTSRFTQLSLFFFFQAEDGIRDLTVTGVQTCALPISRRDDVDLPLALDRVDRAEPVLRRAERVDDAAEVSLPDAHIEHAARALDLVSLDRKSVV